MNEPLTEELLDELLDAPNPATFASKHGIGSLSLSDYLQHLLDKKQLKRPDVIRDAGLNSTFGYQIFTGARKSPPQPPKAISQRRFASRCYHDPYGQRT